MFDYRGLFDRSYDNSFRLEDMLRSFDVLFRELPADAPLSSYGRAASSLKEEDGKFVLTLEAPGLTEKDVRIDLNAGVLTISAEREVTAPEGYQSLRRERSSTRFSRSYALGDKVDPENTTAEIKDGVLTLSIAKAQQSKKKSIAVKVS